MPSPPAAPSEAEHTGPLAIGQKFGPRYHIIKLLGIGGMGAVYQAWDAELDIVVALKVIRLEVTSDPEQTRTIERRFKQELLLARQVTHKNVVRIHDLGEIEGIKYITMSYIEGENLADVLRKGTLPVPTALKLMRQIASGLLAAHEAGVVHRDLKPPNIMVEGDNAIIMDFGIARSSGGGQAAVSPPPDAGPQTQQLQSAPHTTLASTIVGTVAYMAPEQARGDRVDQRADLYALGLIMSDMLLGLRPRPGGPSPYEELLQRMEQAPASPRTVNPQIPEAIDEIVARCVQPAADARFPTTADLVAALARLDDEGRPLPLVRRLTRPMVAAAAVVVIVLLTGTALLTRRAVEVPVQPDPVSVIIADIQNTTNDPQFDQTLEPMLRRALEDAGFITAYDRNRVGALGTRPPERLDEAAARALAVKQGLAVVLAGAIAPQGNGYRISVTATETVTNDVIVTAQARASNRNEVVEVATRLMTRVRNELGDQTSESAQQFAMASLSATSLDVVAQYAAAQAASSGNRFDEAHQYALRAVTADPNFGIGYLLLAISSRNLGRLDEERKYLDEAMSHLDSMTERERFATRGYFYWTTGDYQQCVKEYSELVTRYAGDIAGRNQLALCYSYLREMRRAMQEVQEVVKILPSQPLFRDNLALYANYASEFRTAEQEARAVEGPDAYAALALAFAQLGQGQLVEARATYDRLAQLGARGASFAASGLGDLAAVEGRFGDAVRILRQGATDDLAAGNTDSAAAKLAAVAYTELSRGQRAAAIRAADEALQHSTAVKVRFLAARIFVEAGAPARARPIADGLASELYAEPRAYAGIIRGVTALQAGDAAQAMTLLREANDLFDTWIGLFDLGRASLEAGAFAQADSAFDECLNARRGEALSIFVDEEPTYAYLAPVYYYMGRVREGLRNTRFSESYQSYVTLRGGSTEDPLLTDVRRRIAQ